MATDRKEAKPVPKKDKGKALQKNRRRRVDIKAIGRFFKDVVNEMKKVTWPTRKEFVSYSVAVIVFVVVCGIIIFAMDSALQLVPSYIASLNK